MARKQTAGKEHLAVAKEAGYKRLSPISTFAGTLTGYGAFAILAAIIGAVYSAMDLDTDFSTNNWAGETAASGLATAVSLFLAYLFGGYVAGRMARRAGILHGVAVLLLSLVIGAGVGGLVSAIGDNAEIDRNLQSIGVPTTADEWGAVGLATAVASLVLMTVGAILGSKLGEQWHTKLARRAADPDYGPEAAARDRYRQAEAEREEHLERDTVVDRDRNALRDDQPRDEDADRNGQFEEREREMARRQQELEEREAQARDQRDGEMAHRSEEQREQSEVLDVRDSNTQSGGAHAMGDSEQRYTAAEWAELQRQQAGRGRG